VHIQRHLYVACRILISHSLSTRTY